MTDTESEYDPPNLRDASLAAASRWTAELCRVFNHIFWAPWIPPCEHWPNEGDSLERGMRLDFAAIRRSDACVMVGPKISTGMRRELHHAQHWTMCVHNLIGMPIEKLQDADLVRSLQYHFDGNLPFDYIGILKG